MLLPDNAIKNLHGSKVQELFSGLYGTNPLILETAVKRYTDIISRFNRLFGNLPIALFSTPGRTEVCGNHTDHNAGRVLAAAVNLDVAAAASKTTGTLIRIASDGYPAIELDCSSLAPLEGEKFTTTALVRGICSRLCELGYAIGGFSAVISSDVPKGSGLSSSAAFEVMIVTIINHLYNNGKVNDILNAQISQFAENKFFGKPCGLMDQTTCACGGFVTIDFKDAENPVVQKVDVDFTASGYTLVITDTGGNHADLNDDYASLPFEMKGVAKALGGRVLRDVTLDQVLANAGTIRKAVNDRAILRAIHFFNDDNRVASEVEALENSDYDAFLKLVVESGRSSWMLCQNCFTSKNITEQGITLALALSESILHGKGAWRVHGGGFAGTIQAFVPHDMVNEYVEKMQQVFGEKSCKELMIRKQGTVMIE